MCITFSCNPQTNTKRGFVPEGGGGGGEELLFFLHT